VARSATVFVQPCLLHGYLFAQAFGCMENHRVGRLYSVLWYLEDFSPVLTGELGIPSLKSETWSLIEQGVHEGLRREFEQVVHFFAYADEADG
jgi:hypothetical protein